MHTISKIYFLLLVFFIGGCSGASDYLGFTEKEVPLEGKRISIVDTEEKLYLDKNSEVIEVTLPAARIITEWPQRDMNSTNMVGHAMATLDMKDIWSVGLGTGDGDETRILSQPVIMDGFVYTLDAHTTLRAYNINEGRLAWLNNLRPDNESKSASIGGGIAVNSNLVIVSTAYGYLIALSKDNGKLVWQFYTGAPIRSAPTIFNNRVFVVLVDNKTLAINVENGGLIWRHEGNPELATLMTAASPAVDEEIVVTPYSNGEVVALRADSGVVAWSHNLVEEGRIDSSALLTDIDAGPVISQGKIYVASAVGKLVAIERRSGLRLWDRNIKIVETPAVIGNFIFLINLDGEVVCINNRDGGLVWITSLKEKIGNFSKGRWLGPIVVDEKLVIAGGDRRLIVLDAKNGSILSNIGIKNNPASSPIIVGDNIFIYTRNAELLSLR